MGGVPIVGPSWVELDGALQEASTLLLALHVEFAEVLNAIFFMFENIWNHLLAKMSPLDSPFPSAML